MGEHTVHILRRRYRRASRLRRQRFGVVAVVGTLLALLVFFALFGVFLTQYVPLWMTENESAFTAQTQTSMANLKANMDSQAAFNGPPIYATPFTLSSQGVPLIAQPTAATLNFVPQVPGVFANVSMTVGPGGSGPYYQNFSLGTLALTLPDRYYSPQFFQLENDAVIQGQADTQEIVAFPPLLNVSWVGTNASITMALTQLYGNATQAVSSGVQNVYSHLLFTSTQVSNGGGSAFGARLLMGTHYPCAWATFLNKTLVSSQLPASHWTLSTKTCQASGGLTRDLTLTFLNINQFRLIVSGFAIVLGVGVE
ncbi:MAG: hypothetical protein ACHQ2Y_03480 [Candidatus Lutacidiplasmatales archaeon]